MNISTPDDGTVQTTNSSVNSTTIATYDNGNKLATVQSKAVTHDVDGNLTGIATTSPVSFKTIDWTILNKASTVYQTTGGGNMTYRYLYDGKRYYSRASSGMTDKVFYIFAGDTLLGEITTTTPSAAYTWGADGLISKRNLSTSASSWYEFGPQGETRTLRNSSGTSTDTYYYNAYGEQTSSTGSTVNPYRYGGKYGYYSEGYTGLVLATQRWYSPQLMRWVSRDPIGYKGGANLYNYVNSNPIMFIDPTGLICYYSQSTGLTTCYGEDGTEYYRDTGYSGTGEGRNNPNLQDRPFVGPIPRGRWRTQGEWHNHNRLGRNVMDLVPEGPNPCRGTDRDCNTFRLHGNNQGNDASNGCIILPPNRTSIPDGEIFIVME